MAVKKSEKKIFDGCSSPMKDHHELMAKLRTVLLVLKQVEIILNYLYKIGCRKSIVYKRNEVYLARTQFQQHMASCWELYNQDRNGKPSIVRNVFEYYWEQIESMNKLGDSARNWMNLIKSSIPTLDVKKILDADKQIHLNSLNKTAVLKPKKPYSRAEQAEKHTRRILIQCEIKQKFYDGLSFSRMPGQSKNQKKRQNKAAYYWKSYEQQQQELIQMQVEIEIGEQQAKKVDSKGIKKSKTKKPTEVKVKVAKKYFNDNPEGTGSSEWLKKKNEKSLSIREAKRLTKIARGLKTVHQERKNDMIILEEMASKIHFCEAITGQQNSIVSLACINTSHDNEGRQPKLGKFTHYQVSTEDRGNNMRVVTGLAAAVHTLTEEEKQDWVKRSHQFADLITGFIPQKVNIGDELEVVDPDTGNLIKVKADQQILSYHTYQNRTVYGVYPAFSLDKTLISGSPIFKDRYLVSVITTSRDGKLYTVSGFGKMTGHCNVSNFSCRRAAINQSVYADTLGDYELIKSLATRDYSEDQKNSPITHSNIYLFENGRISITTSNQHGFEATHVRFFFKKNIQCANRFHNDAAPKPQRQRPVQTVTVKKDKKDVPNLEGRSVFYKTRKNTWKLQRVNGEDQAIVTKGDMATTVADSEVLVSKGPIPEKVVRSKQKAKVSLNQVFAITLLYLLCNISATFAASYTRTTTSRPMVYGAGKVWFKDIGMTETGGNVTVHQGIALGRIIILPDIQFKLLYYTKPKICKLKSIVARKPVGMPSQDKLGQPCVYTPAYHLYYWNNETKTMCSVLSDNHTQGFFYCNPHNFTFYDTCVFNPHCIKDWQHSIKHNVTNINLCFKHNTHIVNDLNCKPKTDEDENDDEQGNQGWLGDEPRARRRRHAHNRTYGDNVHRYIEDKRDMYHMESEVQQNETAKVRVLTKDHNRDLYHTELKIIYPNDDSIIFTDKHVSRCDCGGGQMNLLGICVNIYENVNISKTCAKAPYGECKTVLPMGFNNAQVRIPRRVNLEDAQDFCSMTALTGHPLNIDDQVVIYKSVYVMNDFFTFAYKDFTLFYPYCDIAEYSRGQDNLESSISLKRLSQYTKYQVACNQTRKADTIKVSFNHEYYDIVYSVLALLLDIGVGVYFGFADLICFIVLQVPIYVYIIYPVTAMISYITIALFLIMFASTLCLIVLSDFRKSVICFLLFNMLIGYVSADCDINGLTIPIPGKIVGSTALYMAMVNVHPGACIRMGNITLSIDKMYADVPLRYQFSSPMTINLNRECYEHFCESGEEQCLKACTSYQGDMYVRQCVPLKLSNSCVWTELGCAKCWGVGQLLAAFKVIVDEYCHIYSGHGEATNYKVDITIHSAGQQRKVTVTQGSDIFEANGKLSLTGFIGVKPIQYRTVMRCGKDVLCSNQDPLGLNICYSKNYNRPDEFENLPECLKIGPSVALAHSSSMSYRLKYSEEHAARIRSASYACKGSGLSSNLDELIHEQQLEQGRLTITYEQQIETFSVNICSQVNDVSYTIDKGENNNFKYSNVTLSGTSPGDCVVYIRLSKCSLHGKNDFILKMKFKISFPIICGLSNYDVLIIAAEKTYEINLENISRDPNYFHFVTWSWTNSTMDLQGFSQFKFDSFANFIRSAINKTWRLMTKVFSTAEYAVSMALVVVVVLYLFVNNYQILSLSILILSIIAGTVTAQYTDVAMADSNGLQANKIIAECGRNYSLLGIRKSECHSGYTEQQFEDELILNYDAINWISLRANDRCECCSGQLKFWRKYTLGCSLRELMDEFASQKVVTNQTCKYNKKDNTNFIEICRFGYVKYERHGCVNHKYTNECPKNTFISSMNAERLIDVVEQQVEETYCSITGQCPNDGLMTELELVTSGSLVCSISQVLLVLLVMCYSTQILYIIACIINLLVQSCKKFNSSMQVDFTDVNNRDMIYFQLQVLLLVLACIVSELLDCRLLMYFYLSYVTTCFISGGQNVFIVFIAWILPKRKVIRHDVFKYFNILDFTPINGEIISFKNIIKNSLMIKPYYIPSINNHVYKLFGRVAMYNSELSMFVVCKNHYVNCLANLIIQIFAEKMEGEIHHGDCGRIHQDYGLVYAKCPLHGFLNGFNKQSRQSHEICLQIVKTSRFEIYGGRKAITYDRDIKEEIFDYSEDTFMEREAERRQQLRPFRLHILKENIEITNIPTGKTILAADYGVVEEYSEAKWKKIIDKEYYVSAGHMNAVLLEDLVQHAKFDRHGMKILYEEMDHKSFAFIVPELKMFSQKFLLENSVCEEYCVEETEFQYCQKCGLDIKEPFNTEIKEKILVHSHSSDARDVYNLLRLIHGNRVFYYEVSENTNVEPIEVADSGMQNKAFCRAWFHDTEESTFVRHFSSEWDGTSNGTATEKLKLFLDRFKERLGFGDNAETEPPAALNVELPFCKTGYIGVGNIQFGFFGKASLSSYDGAIITNKHVAPANNINVVVDKQKLSLNHINDNANDISTYQNHYSASKPIVGHFYLMVTLNWGKPVKVALECTSSHLDAANNLVTQYVPIDIKKVGNIYKKAYITGRSWHGCSGSPIMNLSGELVGVFGKAQLHTSIEKQQNGPLPITVSTLSANSKLISNLFDLAVKTFIESSMPVRSKARGFLLLAETGTGKTMYFTHKLAMSLEVCNVCVCVPKRIAAQAAWTSFTGIHSQDIEEGKLMVKFVLGEEQDSLNSGQAGQIGDRTITFMTYGKFAHLTKFERDRFTHLLLDEFHDRTDDVQHVDLIIDSRDMGLNTKVLVMTATNLDFDKDWIPLTEKIQCARKYNIVKHLVSEFRGDEKDNCILIPKNKKEHYQVPKRFFNSRTIIFCSTENRCKATIESIRLLNPKLNQDLLMSSRGNPIQLNNLPKACIIVSTDVLESSVTVPECTLVIDYMEQNTIQRTITKTADAERKFTYTYNNVVQDVTKAGHEQRSGRTGRTCNGVVIQIKPESVLKERTQFDDKTLSELALRHSYLAHIEVHRFNEQVKKIHTYDEYIKELLPAVSGPIYKEMLTDRKFLGDPFTMLIIRPYITSAMRDLNLREGENKYIRKITKDVSFCSKFLQYHSHIKDSRYDVEKETKTFVRSSEFYDYSDLEAKEKDAKRWQSTDSQKLEAKRIAKDKKKAKTADIEAKKRRTEEVQYPEDSYEEESLMESDNYSGGLAASIFAALGLGAGLVTKWANNKVERRINDVIYWHKATTANVQNGFKRYEPRSTVGGEGFKEELLKACEKLRVKFSICNNDSIIKATFSDIFQNNGGCIIQCISRDAEMSAGFAKIVQDKYDIRKQLPDEMQVGKVYISDVMVNEVTKQTVRILNLVTKDLHHQKPRLEDLQKCFDELVSVLDECQINEVDMPMIACGLDKMLPEMVLDQYAARVISKTTLKTTTRIHLIDENRELNEQIINACARISASYNTNENIELDDTKPDEEEEFSEELEDKIRKHATDAYNGLEKFVLWLHEQAKIIAEQYNWSEIDGGLLLGGGFWGMIYDKVCSIMSRPMGFVLTVAISTGVAHAVLPFKFILFTVTSLIGYAMKRILLSNTTPAGRFIEPKSLDLVLGAVGGYSISKYLIGRMFNDQNMVVYVPAECKSLVNEQNLFAYDASVSPVSNSIMLAKNLQRLVNILKSGNVKENAAGLAVSFMETLAHFKASSLPSLILATSYIGMLEFAKYIQMKAKKQKNMERLKDAKTNIAAETFKQKLENIDLGIFDYVLPVLATCVNPASMIMVACDFVWSYVMSDLDDPDLRELFKKSFKNYGGVSIYVSFTTIVMQWAIYLFSPAKNDKYSGSLIDMLRESFSSGLKGVTELGATLNSFAHHGKQICEPIIDFIKMLLHFMKDCVMSCVSGITQKLGEAFGEGIQEAFHIKWAFDYFKSKPKNYEKLEPQMECKAIENIKNSISCSRFTYSGLNCYEVGDFLYNLEKEKFRYNYYTDLKIEKDLGEMMAITRSFLRPTTICGKEIDGANVVQIFSGKMILIWVNCMVFSNVELSLTSTWRNHKLYNHTREIMKKFGRKLSPKNKQGIFKDIIANNVPDICGLPSFTHIHNPIECMTNDLLNYYTHGCPVNVVGDLTTLPVRLGTHLPSLCKCEFTFIVNSVDHYHDVDFRVCPFLYKADEACWRVQVYNEITKFENAQTITVDGEDYPTWLPLNADVLSDVLKQKFFCSKHGYSLYNAVENKDLSKYKAEKVKIGIDDMVNISGRDFKPPQGYENGLSMVPVSNFLKRICDVIRFKKDRFTTAKQAEMFAKDQDVIEMLIMCMDEEDVVFDIEDQAAIDKMLLTIEPDSGKTSEEAGTSSETSFIGDKSRKLAQTGHDIFNAVKERYERWMRTTEGEKYSGTVFDWFYDVVQNFRYCVTNPATSGDYNVVNEEVTLDVEDAYMFSYMHGFSSPYLGDITKAQSAWAHESALRTGTHVPVVTLSDAMKQRSKIFEIGRNKRDEYPDIWTRIRKTNRMEYSTQSNHFKGFCIAESLDECTKVFETATTIWDPTCGRGGFGQYLAMKYVNQGKAYFYGSKYGRGFMMPDSHNLSKFRYFTNVDNLSEYPLNYDGDIRKDAVLNRWKSLSQAPDLLLFDCGEASSGPTQYQKWLGNKMDETTMTQAICNYKEQLQVGGTMVLRWPALAPNLIEQFVKMTMGFRQYSVIKTPVTSSCSPTVYIMCKQYSPKRYMSPCKLKKLFYELCFIQYTTINKGIKDVKHYLQTCGKKIPRTSGLTRNWTPIIGYFDDVETNKIVQQKLTLQWSNKSTKYGTTKFDTNIGERLALVENRIKANKPEFKIKNIRTEKFDNLHSLGSYSFKATYPRSRHTTNREIASALYDICGWNAKNSTVGHTQSDIDAIQRSFKKRLDRKPRDPENIIKQRMLDGVEKMVTPEGRKYIGTFRLQDWDSCVKQLNKQGASGKFEHVANIGEFLESHDARGIVYDLIEGYRSGKAVAVYDTIREKREPKLRKDITPSGYLNYDKYTGNEVAIEENMSMDPRFIQFGDIPARIADQIIFGEMLYIHNNVEKLYYGSVTGTSPWLMGNVLRATWDFYNTESGALNYFESVDDPSKVFGVKWNAFEQVPLNRIVECICGDFSSWDATVSIWDLYIEYLFVRQFYHPSVHPILENRYRHKIFCICIDDWGNVFVREGQRGSGDLMTSFGNTFLNVLLHFCVQSLVEGETMDEVMKPKGYIDFIKETKVNENQKFAFDQCKKGRLYLFNVTHIGDGDDNLHFGPKNRLNAFIRGSTHYWGLAGKIIRSGTSGGYDVARHFTDVSFCSHQYHPVAFGRNVRERINASNVNQHTDLDFAVKCLIAGDCDRVLHCPTRPTAEIFGKLGCTLKMSTSLENPSEQAKDITNGKLLSALILYPHILIIRMLAVLMLYRDGVPTNLAPHDLNKRYLMSYRYKNITHAMQSVYGIQSLDEVYRLGSNWENRASNALIYNSRLTAGLRTATRLKYISGKHVVKILSDKYHIKDIPEDAYANSLLGMCKTSKLPLILRNNGYKIRPL